MIKGVITAQTGGREFNPSNFTKYSMFVGGTNATNHALRNYSPLMNNFGRLFMVRVPHAIAMMFGDGANGMYSSSSLFMQFKHMCEYMNRGVKGFLDKELAVAATGVQGGFAGRKFNTPTVTQERTESIKIGLYELVGSPVYTVIDGWMNAIGDENSGLATYGGWISGGIDASTGQETRIYTPVGQENTVGIEFNEANHTCEFIYVLHDRSGAQVERAVMLADCFPKGIQQSTVLDGNHDGTHDNITYDIEFSCILYRSPIITAIANDLLKQYKIVSNSLNFNPELGDAVYSVGDVTGFAESLGPVPTDSATGTNVGNVPVYSSSPGAATTYVSNVDINKAKLSGQEMVTSS